jgi:hypothetical protein
MSMMKVLKSEINCASLSAHICNVKLYVTLFDGIFLNAIYSTETSVATIKQ